MEKNSEKNCRNNKQKGSEMQNCNATDCNASNENLPQENPNKGYNTKKQSLGPNTKR